MGWDIAAAIGGNAVANLIGGSRSRRDAERQMGWQERMSGSAHQREVADLKAAGLNPILSAGGSGASSSGGAMPEFTPPQIDLPMVYKDRELKQTDTKLNQDQQRINIEKANSAAGISKNLSDADLSKARKVMETGGTFNRLLGTDPVGTMRGQVRKVIKDVKQYSPLRSNQPTNLNPHKGIR